MIQPFTVAIPEGIVHDLKARLRATRWPSGVTDSGGLPLSDARHLMGYWRDRFDFKRAASRMNKVSHFKAIVQGLGVHFVHEKSPGLPALLLLHGWPGSFVEMLGVIPLLRPHFSVVVPSLPGYGFSDPPTAAGMSNERMAGLFAELMTALGYDGFFVQGGDWGAGIATWLARKYPERLIGMHLNYIPGSFSPQAAGDLREEEAAFLREREDWGARSGAYGHVQRTRPLTLAYALADSPAGLAAWIAEKFREWSDPSSEIPIDDVLTNITVYWMTNTIGSSVRLYLESAKTPLMFPAGERLHVPCGVAHFPFEAPFPPRSWAERVYNVCHWTEMPRGGHFAALETPELVAKDVTAFASGLTR